MQKTKVLVIALCAVLLLGGLSLAGFGAPVKIKVAYMPYHVFEQQIGWMQKWAAERPDVEIEPVPISYEIFVEKMSANLLASKSEYDIIWVNDDWGQLWALNLEGLDIEAGSHVAREIVDSVYMRDGQDIALPILETCGAMFYRTDLIPSPPKNWQEFQVLAQALQDSGKVKWGWVSGARYHHMWFSFLVALWGNGADILVPVGERRNEVLDAYGWTPMVTDPRVVETVEFWWDNIRELGIAPPGMPAYTRTEADAIFMNGDAAMTFQDTSVYGSYNDPEKSKIVGKVGIARFPGGPSGKPWGWYTSWAWGIPKRSPAENKKQAKELLNWLIMSEEVQRDLWTATGAIPPNVDVQAKLMKEDPLFREFFDATHPADNVLAAYYFPEWAEMVRLLSDAWEKSLAGPRDQIRANLEDLSVELAAVMD